LDERSKKYIKTSEAINRLIESAKQAGYKQALQDLEVEEATNKNEQKASNK